MLVLSYIIFTQILGWQISTVYGSDMNSNFGAGDAVIIGSVEPEAITAGDVISYYSPLNGQVTTHRVIEVIEREEGLFFQTRGDKNEEADPYIVPCGNVTGRIMCQIPLVGYFIHFTRTPTGVVLMVILPGLILIASEIHNLRRNLIPQEKRRRRAKWFTGMKRKDWIMKKDKEWVMDKKNWQV